MGLRMLLMETIFGFHFGFWCKRYKHGPTDPSPAILGYNSLFFLLSQEICGRHFVLSSLALWQNYTTVVPIFPLRPLQQYVQHISWVKIPIDMLCMDKIWQTPAPVAGFIPLLAHYLQAFIATNSCQVVDFVHTGRGRVVLKSFASQLDPMSAKGTTPILKPTWFCLVFYACLQTISWK